MRKFMAALSVCGAMGVLAGCGAGQTDLTQETVAEAEEEGEDMLPGGAYVSDEGAEEGADVWKEEGGDDEVEDMENSLGESDGQPVESVPSHTENASDEATESKGPAVYRKLTEEELQVYTEYVRDISNYGFLLSEWEKPEQIDLMEVFYGGAGISHEGTPEEIAAFLDRYGREGLETDFVAVAREDVNTFLLEKIGLTYDEILAKGNRSLEEIYYPETDSFCFEAGDTNRCMFECIDGVENEEGTIVTLHCKGSEWDRVQECEVEVTKNGGILGNHIIKEIDFGIQ